MLIRCCLTNRCLLKILNWGYLRRLVITTKGDSSQFVDIVTDFGAVALSQGPWLELEFDLRQHLCQWRQTKSFQEETWLCPVSLHAFCNCRRVCTWASWWFIFPRVKALKQRTSKKKKKTQGAWEQPHVEEMNCRRVCTWASWWSMFCNSSVVFF